MRKKYLIYGTGMSGKIAYKIKQKEKAELVGFIDQTGTINYPGFPKQVKSLPVFTELEDCHILTDADISEIIISVGDFKEYWKIMKKLLKNSTLTGNKIKITSVFDKIYIDDYITLLNEEMDQLDDLKNELIKFYIGEKDNLIKVTPFKKRIIIGGPPRTGSTLLRFILDATDSIISGPETSFFLSPLSELQANFLKTINRLKEKLNLTYDDITKCIVNFNNSIEAFDQLMWRYAVKNNRNDVFAWAEKTPRNCYHYHRIYSENTSILFLSIIRNGLDIVTSIYPNTNKYYCSISRYIDSMRAVFSFNHPNHYIIRYEDLVLNTEETLLKLFNFLGLDFNEDVLEKYYSESGTRDYSKVNHDKIKKGIQTDWIGRFTNIEHKEKVNEFLNNEEAMYWLERSGYRLDGEQLIIESFNNESIRYS